MIIDNQEVYLIGASLKDLGKKWFTKESLLKQPLFATFGFSRLDISNIQTLLSKLP